MLLALEELESFTEDPIKCTWGIWTTWTDSVKSHRGRRENFGWHDQIKLHGDGET